MTAGQSISSIGKSMTAIARVEEHLATAWDRIYQFRCYEYRDEIRDELESSVAYVADAGRWVVGIGDWNSKMERRLNQISELVLLANTLLTEYAVTGEVGAEGRRDELDAYLQILSATITLKNVPANGKVSTTTDGRPPIARAQSTTAAEFSSEMSALGTEITGAFSEMFGNKELGRSSSMGQATRAQAATVDNDAMNPFTSSYRRPVDPYTRGANSAGASVSSSVQSLPDGASGVPEYPLSDGDTPEGPLSPVSMGEYECLEIDSIPKYAAFKSSAKLASRRQYTSGSGSNSLAASVTSDGGRSAYSESSAESHELFPLPVSKSMSSLETTKKKPPMQPIMDMNYSYDFQCEAAHNPFLSPNTPGPIASNGTTRTQQSPSSLELPPARYEQANASTASMYSSPPIQISTTSTTVINHTLTTNSVPTTAPPSEAVLGTVAPLPILHEAVDYTHAQAQAHAAPNSRQVPSTQSWNTNGAQNTTDMVEEDATTALVAALRASTTEQDHHNSDHEYDLFGVGK
ncbi:hypothetical protein P3T76_014694 [Phytophthora citrophthora]|uniref:Uncharacterized protein n=1 Tax=Phytophthora citrophthora TaxID=4793 RepID=A0AAD9G1F5_9STRA|nr:hypothetical protein P3T76_014694 [Phytophthora citrophthora]